MTADGILPEHPATGNTPISGLPELYSHLQALDADSEAPLNVKLFDDVYLQLTEDNSPPLLEALLPLLTNLVKTTTQDPQPALALIVKLISPLSFTQTLQIADSETLILALSSPLPGGNQLALKIIEKAAKSPSDAAILSTMPQVVEEMLKRWLETDHTGVGDLATTVLYRLLEVDCETIPQGPFGGSQPVNGSNGVNDTATQSSRHRVPGQGRLWRLIFNRSNLGLITILCQHSDNSNHKTVSEAQGRLLDLIARLAVINFRDLSRTDYADLFPLPLDVRVGTGQGLLQWAALSMVHREDLLMYLNLVDWFERLVTVMRTAPTRSEETDRTMAFVLKEAILQDPVHRYLADALRSLPDRTVEEEAELLRAYIRELLG